MKGSGQMKHPGGSAWSHAQPTGAPKSLMAKHRQSPVMSDPAKAGAPNKGQTATSKGGRGKGTGRD